MIQTRLAKEDHAFARLDLLSILAILLILFLLVLPTAAKNRTQTRATVCFSNLRHLIFAWQLYSHDHHGRLVHFVHGGDTVAGGNTNTPKWASGWLDWEARSENTNLTFLRNPAYARLSDYILSTKNVHKCPADNFQSRVQRTRGMHRVRSVSMNATTGGGNAQTGPWSNTMYRQATNESDIYLPSPAETSVIFEEHPDSINDPSAYPPLSRTTWVDLPSNHHGGAGAFSFADGHVNLRSWRTGIRNTPVRYGPFTPPSVKIGDPDITWLSYHSQRRTQATY